MVSGLYVHTYISIVISVSGLCMPICRRTLYLAGAGAQFEAISAYVKTESVHFHYRMLTVRGCAGLGLA